MSMRVDIATNAIRKPAESASARPRIELRCSVLTSASTSSSFLYIAMRTTILKQMMIAMISRGTIGSFKTKRATIEVQKGLVVKQTIMSDIGAKGAAIFISKKVVWPIKIRHINGHFLSNGNSTTGLLPVTVSQIHAITKEYMFLTRLKSEAAKPSTAIVLYMQVIPVTLTAAKIIAMTATSLLSLFFSGVAS